MHFLLHVAVPELVLLYMEQNQTEQLRELIARQQNGTTTDFENYVLKLWYDTLNAVSPVQLSEKEKEEDLSEIKANLDGAFKEKI